MSSEDCIAFSFIIDSKRWWDLNFWTLRMNFWQDNHTSFYHPLSLGALLKNKKQLGLISIFLIQSMDLFDSVFMEIFVIFQFVMSLWELIANWTIAPFLIIISKTKAFKSQTNPMHCKDCHVLLCICCCSIFYIVEELDAVRGQIIAIEITCYFIFSTSFSF